MTVKIEPIKQTLEAVKVTLHTTDGRRFYVTMGSDGLSFYSDMNSAGSLGGKPITKSADDLFAWVQDAGAKKKFRDRKGVQPRKISAKRP